MDPSNYYGFFLIPWVTLILGWTYVVNDEKISSIGRYFRTDLAKQISFELNNRRPEELFGWEGFGRSDTHRIRRKKEQLVINELTFVVSGIGGLVAFFWLAPHINGLLIISSILAVLLLIVLSIEIYIYADITKGR
jgi:hypothetical protein